MTTADHSAAGQAAGYEQQRQLALVLLCEAYNQDPSVVVRLEAVEDIDVVSDEVSIDSRVQVKHHLKDHTLTDATSELWQTLGVWMDLAEGLEPDGLPNFYLATTSVADPGSAAALLGPEGRDIPTALDRLLNADTEAEQTKKARQRFKDLGTDAQLRLLNAATVLDATSQVTELETRLQRALGVVVPLGREKGFLERLQGWWVGRSVQLLAGERPHISGHDLHNFVNALRDEYRRGSLPLGDALYTEPTEAEKGPLRDSTFVRQLKIVMATNEALDLAVRHYYRAYAQRSEWVRDLHDVGDDIAAYERRLCDEWEIAFVALRAQAAAADPDRARDGLDFALKFPDTVTARLRGLDEPVLCRGTLHGLADELKVGWHPDFNERIEELLS